MTGTYPAKVIQVLSSHRNLLFRKPGCIINSMIYLRFQHKNVRINSLLQGTDDRYYRIARAKGEQLTSVVICENLDSPETH